MGEYFDKFLKIFTDFSNFVYFFLLIITVGIIIIVIYFVTRPTESERLEQRLREERLLREERERKEKNQ